MSTREQPDLLLPLEKYCADSLYPDCDPHPGRTARSMSCEVSRLAVHPHFRRRPGEAETRVGVIDPQFGSPSEDERRTYPMIGMALICAATSTTLRIGRPTVYIVVEDWLAVWLRRAGLPLVQIGSATNYHGRRTAFHVSAEQTVASFKGDSRLLYEIVDRSPRGSVERELLAVR